VSGRERVTARGPTADLRYAVGALGLGLLCACGGCSRPPTGAAGPPATVPTLSANGLTGYLTATANGGAPPAGFTYGFSFYTSASTLNPQLAAGTQLGWGTWLIPDNRTFTQALCPVGTYARDHWADRGPTYRDVYQTIEGGAGAWTSEAFPTTGAKFRINGTADCYSNQIASPGWEFGPQALPADALGLAQLSNRFLVAPDGVVMSGGTSAALLGYAWMALPLIPAYTSPQGVATGDQSWTLFLRASNFTGPVAFYTPEIWSQVNAGDATGTGRGLDAQPAFNGGVALEIGGTPMFTSRDRNGIPYARIPRLTFPATAAANASYAALLDDIHYYSKQALWDAVAAGIQSGTAPSGFTPSGAMAPVLSNTGYGLTLGGDPVGLTSFGPSLLATGSGSLAFSMGWKGALEPGVIPEYYVQSGGTWVPVPSADVPTETGLAQQTFPQAPRRSFPAVDTSAGAPWDASHWAAGPFTVTLGDGSTVEYVWYKFVDQPAIARLGLGQDVRQRLQTFVEAWQAASGLAGLTIAPPISGTLVPLDAAQFVTPPAGLETGYVPIAIRQY
jgi:hypothetical protein